MSKKGLLDLDYSKYDFKDPESYIFKSEKGLSRRTVEDISERKAEPEWMKKFRIRSYEHFMKRAMPTWGGDLNQIDFQDIYYTSKRQRVSARHGKKSETRSRRLSTD